MEEGWPPTQGTFGNVRRHISLSRFEGRGKVRPAPSRKKPGMPLYILPCSGRSSPTKKNQSQNTSNTSAVKPRIKVNSKGSHGSTWSCREVGAGSHTLQFCGELRKQKIVLKFRSYLLAICFFLFDRPAAKGVSQNIWTRSISLIYHNYPDRNSVSSEAK